MEATKKDDGGPAFPHVADFGADDRSMVSGLSLRDWFAGQALSGWLASFGPEALLSEENRPALAQFAYNLADHMLEARKK
jgi:hypothetical protein